MRCICMKDVGENHGGRVEQSAEISSGGGQTFKIGTGGQLPLEQGNCRGELRVIGARGLNRLGSTPRRMHRYIGGDTSVSTEFALPVKDGLATQAERIESAFGSGNIDSEIAKWAVCL